MKKTALILTAILLIGCGINEQKEKFEIKQEIDRGYLYTYIIGNNENLFDDYQYFESVKIDSTTNVKSEYLKAKKVLIRYKEIENEIYNINK